MANRYATVNDTATVTEQSAVIRIDEVTFIANDNASTGDLYLSFENSIASGEDYMVIKAGETFSNLNHLKCHTLWFKASADTVAFRLVGMKVD